MILTPDAIKNCGVKISTVISGVPSFGSGIVYVTQSNCEYDYVMTAKHVLQEDSKTDYNSKKISDITIHYNESGNFRKLQTIAKIDIDSKVIVFDDDFALILIEKSSSINFPLIIVTDHLLDDSNNFFSWEPVPQKKTNYFYLSLKEMIFNQND